MKPVTLFKGTSGGLNTVVDPVRLPFDPKTGMSDLGVAVNVRIDSSGRPGRRKGSTKVQSGDHHSLFCDGGDCFVVRERTEDAALYQVGTDLVSAIGVRSSLAKGARMAFAQAGSQTFYSNGYQNGVVEGGVSSPWPVQEYKGTKTNRSFSPAPVGSHLAWAFGRMFIAEDSFVWWSERFQYGLYNKVRSYWKFGSKVLMIKPVAAGLFISDEKATWFYAATNPKEAIPIKVADYPALEWSDAIENVEGKGLGVGEKGLCALWASPEGACVGTASGQFENMNKEKVVYPEDVRQGAGLLQGYNFIHTMR